MLLRVQNCSLKHQSPVPAQGFCFRMCRTSICLKCCLWQGLGTRARGILCWLYQKWGTLLPLVCVLKLVPSIFLLLEDADCDYSFQERVTEMSTSFWKQTKHEAATAPINVVQWHLQGDCYLWKMGSKPQGSENFINYSTFYFIRKEGLTPALLEKSAFKRGGDQHIWHL